MKYGIDVSHYQGNINWKAVSSSKNVNFVIMKAMYESNKKPDETFEANYAGATDAGINKGVYNFIGSVSASNPDEDARAFLNILNGRKLEYGIWLDVESKNLRDLGKNKVEEVIIKEAEIFTSAGYYVGIYCNLDWYKNVITDKIKKMFDGRFWIARYPKNDNGIAVGKLSPAEICPESIGWQYSSKGKVNGIIGNVDMDMFWGEIKTNIEPKQNTYSRMTVVNQANSWLGLNEADNSFMEIINEYNKQVPLPSGYKLKSTDSWCAGFATSVFTKVGYGSIFPCECSCERMRKKAIEMGIWVESDSFVPQPGDAILYDWQDNINFANTDNTGMPDHVGIVTYVNTDSGYIVVTEGNYSDSVKKRTININGRYIRGYITPKFNAVGVIKDDNTKKDVNTLAHEVIAGQWGSSNTTPTRVQRLESAGYNYSDVQSKVNSILNSIKKPVVNSIIAGVKPQKIDKNLSGEYTTTANLYLRDGAGTDKKSLVLIPKGMSVSCNGNYSISNGVIWLYIQVKVGGITYTGFSSSKYLRR